ncbi:Shedu anti-phage system protein SduA domain-containing protein [Nocardia farcinica]|uniref:Shedu anti-phage system protein SduA domain-containing protein n=1 Tax=Nocardia farcinica TaxID=37329 RepID=UPI002454D0C8|nr:Shedu anti-phage system protein SduA domain-containing protein [Nocardia farcinica]
MAAAYLRNHLQQELWLGVDENEPLEARVAYLAELAEDAGFSVPTVYINLEEFEAWLTATYRLLSVKYLRELKPEPGDIVARKYGGPPFQVSSIGDNGVIHGKGVGNRGHANELEMVARVGSPEYSEAQRQANFAAAARAKHGQITAAARAELEEYRVSHESGPEAHTALDAALREAKDERPLQRVIEQYPELLRVLVGRKRDVWVIPQLRLGGTYVADFVVAGMTSAGMEWVLVELESPTAKVHIGDGDYAKEARHGGQQIRDWRLWIEDNIGTARASRTENGLGLYGIGPNAGGVVIVGRSEGVTAIRDGRRSAARQDGIYVHTYDWLLRENERPSPFGLSSFDDESQYRR